jgi:hypothetical protein
MEEQTSLLNYEELIIAKLRVGIDKGEGRLWNI